MQLSLSGVGMGVRALHTHQFMYAGKYLHTQTLTRLAGHSARICVRVHIRRNKEVRAKIQQAIGPHKDLLTIVKGHKLQWDGHVSRSSGLAKTILQGTVKGGRRQGRQRKKWEDNIRE